jgi:hypothetical protein
MAAAVTFAVTFVEMDDGRLAAWSWGIKHSR